MSRIQCLTRIAAVVALVAGYAASNGAANACQQYSAAEISQAIQNSPYANQTLKNNACNMGGAAQSESGGNSCSVGKTVTGVLQVQNQYITGQGMSVSQYQNADLQTQVNIWAKTVGNGNSGSAGYQYLSANMGQTVGGQTITPGMAAACFQFGPVVCNNDVKSLQAGGGCSGNGVRAGSGGGSPGLDGNGMSICTWGSNIQGSINKNSGQCKGQPATPAKAQPCTCPGGREGSDSELGSMNGPLNKDYGVPGTTPPPAGTQTPTTPGAAPVVTPAAPTPSVPPASNGTP